MSAHEFGGHDHLPEVFGPGHVEYCPVRTAREGVPESHCDHWWDCEPCCTCGSDEGDVNT